MKSCHCSDVGPYFRIFSRRSSWNVSHCFHGSDGWQNKIMAQIVLSIEKVIEKSLHQQKHFLNVRHLQRRRFLCKPHFAICSSLTFKINRTLDTLHQHSDWFRWTLQTLPSTVSSLRSGSSATLPSRKCVVVLYHPCKM